MSGHSDKAARAVYARKWRAKRTPEQKAKGRQYQDQWVKANWPRVSVLARDSHLRRKYGITVQQVEDIPTKQGGRCAICGAMLLLGSHTHVDHDHDTGQVRGLLCVNCNNGLGQFRDRPELLRAAATYLEAVATR
jgi:hypothetical protein